MKKIDTEAIKEHIKGILIALGDDPDREGLRETPERVAHMYEEMFGKTFSMPESDGETDLVVVRDIDLFSYCEHHMALMYDMKATIAYIPKGRVIGLSKIIRIAEMAAKRLQLQERIGSDIAEIMQKATGSEDVAVLIEASHSCMTARGIKNTAARTYTTKLCGRFKTDKELFDRIKER
jgi:GTP cyclohydrolase I